MTTITEHEITAAKFKLAGSLALLVVLCVVSLLSGCARKDPEPEVSVQTAGWLNVETDDATGCQYLGKHNSSAGITPRIAADGKSHMGCKEAHP